MESAPSERFGVPVSANANLASDSALRVSPPHTAVRAAWCTSSPITSTRWLRQITCNTSCMAWMPCHVATMSSSMSSGSKWVNIAPVTFIISRLVTRLKLFFHCVAICLRGAMAITRSIMSFSISSCAMRIEAKVLPELGPRRLRSCARLWCSTLPPWCVLPVAIP